MPTQMIYTTTLRQINYIVSWMESYIKAHTFRGTEFEKSLCDYMNSFIRELDRVNVLEDGLLKNEKHRTISLFGKDLDKIETHFGDVYSTNYKGSFAQLAQAHRHRTLDYKMEFLKNKEYFIPPIIADEPALVDEWLGDMNEVKELTPQGELVMINEVGFFYFS